MQKARTLFIFGLSALTALLCIGSVFFFLHVIKNKNEHSSNAIASLQQKIAQKNSSTIVKKKIDEVQAEHDSVAGHIVDMNTVNTFVDYLEAFGANANTVVSVRDVKLAPKDKNGILASISISGTFANVEKAIGLFENDQYQIHILSLSFTKDTPPVIVTKAGDPVPPPQIPTWHADISLSVLSS
jgi:hypothetical protein